MAMKEMRVCGTSELDSWKWHGECANSGIMKTRSGYSGVHMFDRNSGVNILLDEVAVAPAQWSVAPRYVSIALTNACELNCSYCYASKEPARLNAERVAAWATELDHGDCFGIGFGGGEPTIYPGFAALCTSIHATTNLALSMTTHGHRFTPRLTQQLCGNIEFIRLSMDGIGNTYERLRGRPFSSFAEKLGLVKATARFGVNFVVNEDTIGDLERGADFAFEHGAEEFLLLPETGMGGALTVRPETMERLSEWVRKNYQRCRLATSAHGGALIDAPMLMQSVAQYESFDFMHIDAFGVIKTSAFAKTGVVLGDGSVIDSIQQLRGNDHRIASIDGKGQFQ
jgi:MoaA/NifB/PqqE/SkfB family radical SAM enzyme